MRDSSTRVIIALTVAILLIILLPVAVTQENNTSMNNTTLMNITVFNKTNNVAEVETNQSVISSEGSSILRIGKGLSRGSLKPELALGSPAKPMKDLEKVVFICNIL